MKTKIKMMITDKEFSEIKFTFDGNHVVNGYNLADIDECWIPLENMKILLVTWNKKESMTDDQFRYWFDHNTCCDWGKMDENGESYNTIYWKKKDKNALEKTHAYNREKILELPFKRNLMSHVINFCCSYRHESVLVVNLVCIFLETMFTQLMFNRWKNRIKNCHIDITFSPDGIHGKECVKRLNNFK